MSRFDDCLAFVLRHEGGFVDDPDDPGGATNRGITQATYDGWRLRNSLGPESVKFIKADEVAAIYRSDYWNKASCDKLPAPIDLVQFDTAVNQGVDTADRILQAACGVVQDGVVGPVTLQAVNAYNRWVLIGRYANGRISRYVAIAQMRPKSMKFLHGWLRRVGDLLAAI